jgi:uncharacterized protein (TIRG00374 family)
MKKKISRRALLIKALLSGAFFWILISFVQTNQLVEIISRIDWLYFILSFVLTPVMLCVSCLKWKMVLDLQERKIPFLRLTRIYLIGYFFSNLLPSTVGGDVARSYYSGKIIKNQSFSAIAIFIERFSGVFFLFFLVILAPLIKTDLYRSPYIYIPSIGSLALLLITLWIWRVQYPLELPHRLAQWIFSSLFKFVSFPGLISVIEVLERKYLTVYNRLEKLHDELGAAVTTIRKNRSLFVRIVSVTVLFYLLTWLNVYLAFMAFGVKPEFLGICALVSTVLFVAQVPVTLLGNLGFFESVFVFYFLLIGVPAAETLAMGLLLRLKMLTIGGVGYLVYLSYSDAKYIGEEFEQLEQSV